MTSKPDDPGLVVFDQEQVGADHRISVGWLAMESAGRVVSLIENVFLVSRFSSTGEVDGTVPMPLSDPAGGRQRF